jgi:hypothetical protein
VSSLDVGTRRRWWCTHDQSFKKMQFSFLLWIKRVKSWRERGRDSSCFYTEKNEEGRLYSDHFQMKQRYKSWRDDRQNLSHCCPVYFPWLFQSSLTQLSLSSSSKTTHVLWLPFTINIRHILSFLWVLDLFSTVRLVVYTVCLEWSCFFQQSWVESSGVIY